MIQPPAPTSTATKSVRIFITVIVLAGAAVLLFARLGHYSLWDDEALTAMTARGVWRTGDTSALPDAHNVLAYRHGLLIRNLHDRYTPPLPFYLLAPVIGLFGESPFVCRLPFALCGLGAVAILLRWLWRRNPRPLVWGVAAALLLTNASFFLFCRQCRYYAPSILFTTGILYYYCVRAHGKRASLWLSLWLLMLLCTQYINYAAAIGCLCIDYAIWGRKHSPFARRDWLIVLLPQLVVGGAVVAIWNPLKLGGADTGPKDFADKLVLLWWNWRDLIASGFVILPLLVMCPLMYLYRQSNWLLRAPAALGVYVTIVAACAASPVKSGFNAELRYAAPAIPLCMVIGVLAVWAMEGWRGKWQAAVLEVALLGSVVQPFPSAHIPVFEPTAFMYYCELLAPQDEPYAPTLAWMREHVKNDESILIEPDWMMYPLMFADPRPVYAWQLDDPPGEQFRGFPDIHIVLRVAPDWLIAYGPYRKEMQAAIDQLKPRGVRYNWVQTLHVHWQDLYRPERVWREFATVPPKDGEEVYIYKKSVTVLTPAGHGPSTQLAPR